MLEEITQHINQLKNLVSLRYIDPLMREQCMQTINSHIQEHQGLGICEEYIMKIEQSHEKMMGQLSQFLDRLTPTINDYHSHLDNLQQELACNNKMHQLELEEQQNHQKYLSERIETMTQQLQAKEQDIRELTARLEEREAQMQMHERQERDYLNKIQIDFDKQQKALEEAVFLIARRDQELKRLQGELSILKEPRIKEIVYKDIGNVSHDDEQQEHSIDMASHRQQSENSYSLVQCSFVTSPSRSEGLQQFEELKVEHRLEEVLVSQQMQGLEAPKTLRQMLNLSLQKQYKLLYNKCDSVEGIAKQNYQRNWGKQSKSKSDEKKMQWGINQSLQLLDSNKIKEFKLPLAGAISKQNNPYYHYFVIASQNVKIRSKHFQQFCNVSTQQEWKYLCQRRVPLHQWQAQIEQYLMRQCNISS